MKLNLIKIGMIISIFSIALGSCSVATESKELVVPSQEFTFEDIYEGGNTATVGIDLKDLISNTEGVSLEKLDNATVKSITISKNDSLGLSEISGAKFQLMCDGEELPMITVGVLDEIKEGENSVSLSMLDDVEISEYLKEEKAYLILDINYLKDNEVPQKFKVGINFELNVSN